MRKPRILVENGCYHVIGAMNFFSFLLFEDSDKELFLKTLEEALQKHDFKVKNFCVMTNHLHMILKVGPEANLSRIIQWLFSTFAKRYNKKHKLRGHLFYDRFVSKVIASEEQFVTTMFYITQNPVKAKIAQKATEYVYCGFYHLLKGIKTILCLTDEETAILLASG